MRTKEISGTYGNQKTPCTVFVYGNWYVCEGSVNINEASDADALVNGVDVETIQDIDTMTASEPIEDIDQLVALVDD